MSEQIFHENSDRFRPTGELLEVDARNLVEGVEDRRFPVHLEGFRDFPWVCGLRHRFVLSRWPK